ncbi:MAG TPA: hypothetical protein PLY93_00200 [Turneriella sp.]|nr:hypothetical protein [Turneriella sp.]
MKKILFHHPLPLDPNAKSASGIRPQRMLQAFKDLGYEVELITGYAKERKTAIRQIKKNIRNGVKYEFVYAESSTMPNILTEKHHLPTHPFIDCRFFQFCKKNKILIGLFYRDIYWRFEEYRKALNMVKVLVAKLAYRFDLYVYQRTVYKFYLPSLEMAKYIPTINQKKFRALPPGHASPVTQFKPVSTKLKLFYVGGFSSHYQMHVLFNVLKQKPTVELTLCTREDEWLKMRAEYPEPSANIKIIHKVGHEMERELLAADIAVLFVKPQEYREFAAPVKLYEYIGFKKPILASKKTLAGKFVDNYRIGWAINYDENALIGLLNALEKHPDRIRRKVDNLEKISTEHSWRARAKQVIQDLTQ